MEEEKNCIGKALQEHLSNEIDAPVTKIEPGRKRTPKIAGNKSFRRHNNLRFMITERRRELGKRK
jgi:hypothetical protein